MKNTTIRHLLILCLAGIGIGLAGFIIFPRMPLLSDSITYFTVARNLFVGIGLVSSFATPNEAFIMGLPCPDIHMPVWPILLAGFMWFTLTGLYAPLALNILLAISSALAFYFTVRAWSAPNRALVGSLFFLMFPLTLAYEFTGLTELCLVLWSLITVCIVSVSSPKKAPLWLAAIGLTYVFAYASRQTSVFLIPLVSLILLERGFSRSVAICFGIALVLISVVASLAYSRIDSLSDAQYMLFRYDFLLHTGFIKKSFYHEILTPADINPGVPMPELLLAILVKKPIRMLAYYLGPDNILRFENLMKLLVIAIFAVGLFVVRNKRIRWGLLAFLPVFLMAVWFYKFEARQFFALSAVTLCFVFAFIGNLRIKPWLTGLIFSFWAILGVLCAWEVQRERVAIYFAERTIAPALAASLPSSARVAAGYPSTIALYRPDIAVVTMPASLDDLALLKDKLALDAIVLAVHEPAIVSWGWTEDTMLLGSETLFLYKKPR